MSGETLWLCVSSSLPNKYIHFLFDKVLSRNSAHLLLLKQFSKFFHQKKKKKKMALKHTCTVRHQGRVTLGEEGYDWAGAQGDLWGLSMFCFLIWVLITWVWSVHENSLSCTFRVYTLWYLCYISRTFIKMAVIYIYWFTGHRELRGLCQTPGMPWTNPEWEILYNK